MGFTASGLAAPMVLNVEGEGWTAMSGTAFPEASVSGTPSKNGTITLAPVPTGSKVYAFNVGRNLGVVLDGASLAGKTVRAEDATHLLTVNVTLVETRDGKLQPYKGEAGAELKDAERTQEGRTTSGVLLFRWVRLGDARVQVTTRGADNLSRTVGQGLTIERNGLSGYTVDVGSPGPSAGTGTGMGTTSGAAAPSATSAVPASTSPPPASASTPASAAGPNIFGNILSTLIGLGVVAGLGYAGWRYAQRNPDAVKAGLAKIGAETPGPLEPEDPPAPTPASTPDPVPSGPILLAPPDPISIPQAPISVASASVTGVPKLVSPDGGIFEIPEGETVVGREALGGLMVAHETVSRNHARLVRSGNSVRVEDLGSTNGTFVNGAPAPAPLNGGEAVRFGQVEYRYEG